MVPLFIGAVGLMAIGGLMFGSDNVRRRIWKGTAWIGGTVGAVAVICLVLIAAQGKPIKQVAQPVASPAVCIPSPATTDPDVIRGREILRRSGWNYC